MPLLPYRFFFRLCYPCRRLAGLPREDDDRLLDLPADCRIDNFAAMDGQRTFADVRLAWNELGLAVQVEVTGKTRDPEGDIAHPRTSDGVTVWIDTRDARGSHRASRYCHQFHFLPTGSGPERDEPAWVQAKIHRALQDAPQAPPTSILFRSARLRSGYRVEAFLSATALTGFDPEQSPRLGFFYVIHDAELGDQTLSVGPDFPYWEDPSLWSVLELLP
ncbi:MAG: hypothetical protein NZ700_15210 [Gemmataceae bacterium]|nr:hypothetical protein [Gemmataceae bacterium]MDW8267371.1 hypothetical protein [Gemmataceae bacterium]